LPDAAKAAEAAKRRAAEKVERYGAGVGEWASLGRRLQRLQLHPAWCRDVCRLWPLLCTRAALGREVLSVSTYSVAAMLEAAPACIATPAHPRLRTHVCGSWHVVSALSTGRLSTPTSLYTTHAPPHPAEDEEDEEAGKAAAIEAAGADPAAQLHALVTDAAGVAGVAGDAIAGA
jgi:hypothetical protein